MPGQSVPSFLSPDVAAAFSDASVAASYRHRPSYPPVLFDLLARRIVDGYPAVLDLGCGTGFVARPLAQRTERVDAVDVSAAMIDAGRQLPGGDDPRIWWIVGRAEAVTLDPPYGLVTAGDSLHWMDWGTVLPRIGDALAPAGLLAIVTVHGSLMVDDDTRQAIVRLIQRFTTFSEWRPEFDLARELEHRGLFRITDREQTAAVQFRQSVQPYVESFHARASLSWGRMSHDAVEQFDDAMERLLRRAAGDTVEQSVRGSIVWGRPLAGSKATE